MNPTKGNGFLTACANEINKHFTQKYDPEKIQSIVAGVIKKRNEGTLETYFNKERQDHIQSKIKTYGERKTENHSCING